VLQEHFAGDARIRAPGEIDVRRSVGNLELDFERAHECFDARPSGADERAVNVEENQADHRERLDQSRNARQR